jgi:hypothetical protein
MLLFIAAVVWTFAGSMLLFKGMKLVLTNRNHLISIVSGSAIAGTLFYLLVFSKISLKHTRRIISLKNDYPCFFSFFNLKSYILMSIMITSGIIIRLSGLVPSTYLSIVYLTMGIPLFVSAFRFYYYGLFYKSALDMRVNTGF